MKKVILSVFFASCCINAYIPEKLEQAIRDSDLEVVKEQLLETSLSANELLSLIDLSQQIIHYRRGAEECNRVSIKNTPEQGVLFLGASLSSIALVPLSLLTLASILDGKCPKSDLLLGTAASLICSIFCWDSYFQSLNDERTMLKRLRSLSQCD